MKNIFKTIALVAVLAISSFNQTQACTGIRLIAEDGGVIFGRTLEWSAFDINTRVGVVPRGYKFTGLTPDGKKGMEYTAKYGFVGLDFLDHDLYIDGMNEAGLTTAFFYHLGHAVYNTYEPANASNTISAQELNNYMLSKFATISEVKEGLKDLTVVGVIEEKLGFELPLHWMITDKSGESIVLEYRDGELKVFENPLGIVTNAPEYDWHMTNLRNYIGLSENAHTAKVINGVTFKPTGAGSGMLGLPGDNTPASRFVRLAAWGQTVRPTETASETSYELFRILDNFNLPLGPDGGEGASGENEDGQMRSSTLWTSGWNSADMTLTFHTQHNRRLRMIDLNKINFEKGKEIKHITVDETKEEDIKELKL